MPDVSASIAPAELAVGERNAAALAVYREAGFEPTDERRTIASDPDQMGVFLARPL